MSKEIAQTVSSAKIAWLIAIVAAFAVLATFASAMRAEAADPPDAIAFSKAGQPASPGLVYFTLTVENQTPLKVINPDTESQTTQVRNTGPLTLIDPLPTNATWVLVGDSITDSGGTIDCSIDNGQLVCYISGLDGRHLNNNGTAFVNGKAEIVLYGLTKSCGTLSNTALLYGGSGGVLSANGSVVDPCPATPTPTATPTTVPPTVTPTIVPPTATPTKVPPTATPTVRIVPLPPNTGNAEPPADKDYSAAIIFTLLGFGAIAFGVGGTIIARRR